MVHVTCNKKGTISKSLRSGHFLNAVEWEMREPKIREPSIRKHGPCHYSPLQHEHIIWGFTGLTYGLIDQWLEHLRVLDRHPRYKENLELDGFSYEEVKKRNDECFKLLRKLVDRHQVEIVGGSYSAPPMILIEGESNLRQILFGKNLIKQLFGVDVKCFAVQEGGMCINPQLPQMLKKTGYDSCILGCLADYHFVKGIGVDEIEIPTIMKSYHDPLPQNPDTISEIFKKCQDQPNRLVIPMPDWSWGAAKTGWINKAMKQKRLSMITASTFFSKHHPRRKSFLSEVEWKPETEIADLGAPRVAALLDIGYGCQVPKTNKRSENLLITAEKCQGIAAFLGFDPDFNRLEGCWKNLFNAQAHDVYFDGCIPSLKEWAINLSMRMANQAEQLLSEALDFIANNVDTELEVPGWHLNPVIVFNPLSWERTELVVLNQFFKSGEAYQVGLLDRRGEPVPHQIEDVTLYPDETIKTVKICLSADLPSLGYNTYYVCFSRHHKEVKFQTEGTRKKRRFIENEFVNVSCTYNGEIRIDDLATSREVFRGGFLTLHDEEGCDDSRKHPVSLKNVMIGKIQSKLAIEGCLRCGSFETTMTLGTNSRKVYFETTVRVSDAAIGDKVVWWCMHPESALSNNLIINLRGGTLSYDFPFGYGQKDSMMIFPLSWIDYSNDEWGVSVFHRGTHGFWIKGGEPFHMTNLWLWSQLEGQDWKKARLLPKSGEYTYQYAIMPHKKDSPIFHKASEYNNPPIAVETSLHSGSLPRKKSFININEKNVILSAIIPKPRNTIIRLYEILGQKTNFKMSLNLPVTRRIEKVDFTGQHVIEILNRHGNSMSTIMNPHDISCYSIG